MEATLKSFMLENGGGNNFKYLLEKSICTDMDIEDIKDTLEDENYESGQVSIPGTPCRTLQAYENQNVIFEGQLLEENDIKYPVKIKVKKGKKTTTKTVQRKYEPLSSIRVEYLESIVSNLEKYFPSELLYHYDLFDQR